VTSGGAVSDTFYLKRALEVFIHIGFITLLAVTCFLVLRPFIAIVAWGLTIAVAGYPAYRKLQNLAGGRSRLAAVLFTILLIAAVIAPIMMLSQTLIDGAQALAAKLQNGTLAIPSPPPKVAGWPIIGKPLSDVWSLASTNLSAVLGRFAPQLKGAAGQLLSAAAAVGLGTLQCLLSIMVAGALLANSSNGARVTRKLAIHLFGNRAEEFEALAVATVRSVTIGILGVALIQTLFAGLGFLVVRLPGAGLWAFLFLIAAVLQVGGLALIPAVIYVFATAGSVKATAFLMWCILVALLDNVLKPVLLGRGLPIPIVIVFLGAMGGFLAMGIIGLFVGPIILSVGYKVLLAWLDEALQLPAEREAKRASSA